ncbi:MAG: hypothetical protein KAT04_04570 [Methylococcales bacterium]|nr:hypothetical protein [Methylococcales bacterium]
MKFYFILFLFTFVSSVFAEHTEAKNQVYNQQSQSNVDALNNTVEVLRNPTVMSGNFRQALKNIRPNTSTSTTPNSDNKDMPFIELVAKIYSTEKDSPSTVVLRVDDHILHLAEGSTASQMINRKIVNIEIQQISKDSVTIFLPTFGLDMVLQ